MPRISRLLVPFLLLSAGLARPALAQTSLPLSAELRAGAAFPMGDFNDGASTGWIVGGTVRYRTNPSLGFYAGYDFANFPPVDEDPGVGVSIRDQGVRAGLRTELHAAATSTWVELGLLLNQTSVRAHSGGSTGTVRADWALGGEVGGGLSIPLGRSAALTPGVRYRRHEADFDTGLGKSTVSYFVVDLGLAILR